jgi:hypothetical protein
VLSVPTFPFCPERRNGLPRPPSLLRRRLGVGQRRQQRDRFFDRLLQSFDLMNDFSVTIQEYGIQKIVKVFEYLD